jgi:hypothetical protein
MRKQTPAHAQAWLVCVDPAQQDWLQLRAAINPRKRGKLKKYDR